MASKERLITIVRLCYSEAFISVIPYVTLMAVVQLVFQLLSYFHIQIASINEIIVGNIAQILSEFFSLVLLIAIAHQLAKRFKVNQIITTIISVAAFVTIETVLQGYRASKTISVNELTLLAMIIPISVVFSIRLSNPHHQAISPINAQLNSSLNNVFSSISTYFGVVLLFVILQKTLVLLNFSLPNIDFIPDIFLLIIRTICNHLFWFVGIHGDNFIDAIFGNSFLKNSVIEGLNYKQFYDLFVIYGGSGAGLSLILAILFCAKDKQSKHIAKLATPFVIFNINEILIFGLPIIFNRHLIIPFILVPLINLLIAWNLLSFFTISFSTQSYSWITPVFINAYIATDKNVFAIVLQAILIVLGTLIYIPFIKKYTASQSYSEQLNKLSGQLDITNFLAAGESFAAHKAQASIIQSNYQLEKSINLINDNKLVLYYQPKVNIINNTCNHFEALLRMELSSGEIVTPDFLENIENSGLASIIDLWVCVEVNKDMKKWLEKGFQPQISINLHPDTLSNNENINQIITMSIGKNIDFEVIDRSDINIIETIKNLQLIKREGFSLSLDDFGASYSSLITLVKQSYDYLKIDKNLIDFIRTPEGYSICKTIVNICKELGVTAIAEGVETKEQLELVRGMGIHYVQGHYFSPALSAKNLENYVPHSQL